MSPRASSNPDVALIEAAFDRKRQDLGVRTTFPDEVQRAAEAAAKRDPAAVPGRVDRTEVPFVTIDPPGSRDLDQALRIERGGDGFRVWYAIADVGFWVERGGPIEAEAWQRGVTFYAPDRRHSLYPPVLSEGAASLLPDAAKPAILFVFDLDARAEIVTAKVERALVRSRAQLTYQQVLEDVASGGKRFGGEPWGDSLPALKAFGELRREREVERGGVSLPILGQHVQRTTAASLGYELEYEKPSASEDWNSHVSLLTGHLAAVRMIEAKVGIVRVLAPAEEDAVRTFRRVARALGFPWPPAMTYAEFIRSLDLSKPNVAPLVWQAKRVSRGADYVAFDGEPPADPVHHALAMLYAHCTAPLRRLADRYVLDLVADLEEGRQPSPEARATLPKVAARMNEAETRGARLERGAVDVAEAWLLRERVGERFNAIVLGMRDGKVEVQIENPPVRADVKRGENARWLDLGEPVSVTLASVKVEEGKTIFELAE
ncbi:MAG TPA: RNB domain-containing ribonuclease [Longimicrobium sp.]|nr:RNB domain-containing ribonuclease [Longimicrobium sp.]